MSIDFGPERWELVKEVYRLFWEGKLDRPVIPVVLAGKDPCREQPGAPLLSQATCCDLSISPKDIVDRIDYELSKLVYLGDAFPYFNMHCFGPGVVAAFLDADLDNSTGRVWFHPKKVIPISELHFEYNKNNIWLNRIKEICNEAMKRWQGQVLVGMTDLGGSLDILSTFRPTEKLLLDLYDYPDEVKRLTWEIHDLWFRFFDDINNILQPINPGYSDWAQIYSDRPGYVIQCDFSYMLGPSMFNEFVRPEIEAACRKLDRSFYHLDGVGQLKHLDSILGIKELNGVQWVPGAGKPEQDEWPEVQLKIIRTGKFIQLWGGFDCLDRVIGQLGTGNGIHHTTISRTISESSKIKERLSTYGLSR